jgi:hypothetical protein
MTLLAAAVSLKMQENVQFLSQHIFRSCEDMIWHKELLKFLFKVAEIEMKVNSRKIPRFPDAPCTLQSLIYFTEFLQLDIKEIVTFRSEGAK